jgi:cytochrome b involved in lipid metabolism
MSQTFSKDQVASHSKGDSLWVVIDEDVYDLTKFQDDHPGELRNARALSSFPAPEPKANVSLLFRWKEK